MGLKKPRDMTTIEIKDELQYFEENFEEKSSGELKRYPGLGILDTGIKKWLEDSKTISRDREDKPYRVNYIQYYEFQRKRELLEILRERRAYREEQENKQKSLPTS